MSIKNIIIVCVLFFVMCIMLPMWTIGTKNHAISLEESVTNSYSDINVQEKRRVDLIYNLADIAKKYAKHEKETFEAITNARSSKSSDVENAALSIQAVQEAYPELKADKTFTNLQLELATTENLIAEHRKAYNLSAKIYRQYVRRFPNSMFLSVFGYEQIEAKSLNFGAESKEPIKNMFGD